SSVETLERGARVVCGDDLLIVLPCPRATYRPPLAEPHAMAGAGAVGDDSGDSTAAAGHRQGEGIAAKLVVRGGPQDLANEWPIHVPPRSSQRIAESPYAPRTGARGHAQTSHVSHFATRRADTRRERPPQGASQGFSAPLLVPTESRRDAAIRGAVLGEIGNGPQIRPVGSSKHLDAIRRASTTGGVEEGIDWSAVVRQDLSARRCDRRVALRCLGINATVHLVRYARVEIESVLRPATDVPQRVGSGHHRLGPERLLFGGASSPHFGRHDTQEISLQRYTIHQGDTRAIPQNRQGSAIPSSIDHHRGATVTRDDVELRGRGGVSTGRADDGD